MFSFTSVSTVTMSFHSNRTLTKTEHVCMCTRVWVCQIPQSWSSKWWWATWYGSWDWTLVLQEQYVLLIAESSLLPNFRFWTSKSQWHNLQLSSLKNGSILNFLLNVFMLLYKESWSPANLFKHIDVSRIRDLCFGCADTHFLSFLFWSAHFLGVSLSKEDD